MLTCHIFSCDLLRKDESVVTVPFSSVHAVEMTDYLAENFKMRFNDFCSHAINIRIFENAFSIEVSDAPEKLQL
jgi:Ran GTPase-activating protein (RanGAP) involved in mRNA processing and transport